MLFGAANDYRRTFSYEAVVNGQVPETITNTAVATSSSGNPALAHVWSTHYLYVRLQTYLPLLRFDEVVDRDENAPSDLLSLLGLLILTG